MVSHTWTVFASSPSTFSEHDRSAGQAGGVAAQLLTAPRAADSSGGK